ncbi:ADP-ribosylglycohydrolase family protein [Plectonema radiosum NIES-515]|uniref:ADP-ribosylglycohydrolase family protein n=1 Tax=Plectonema radiosum NIES-515 TaxID=2986073 RepID=A0ABT3AVB2_9CYAN|nr:ADP-ribosylglycohydrolase family protein [Plectonema radiosum]MCV3213073.1 ADP-ribosylglycohydrolase family protein [Plectonema radiosum NIES-515]
MRYSLESRFRGTIIGAFLGDLASGSQEQPKNWHEIALLGAASLITTSQLNLDDWNQRQESEFPDLDTSSCVCLKAIIATLPVALFYFDNTVKLRQNLICAIAIWDRDLVVRDGTLAVGYAIAQSLTEKLDRKTLIPQTIDFIGETSTSLPQALLKVNNLLIQGAGLERVQGSLSREEKLSKAVAMAFYCFMSTLEDFRLSILRATDNNDALHTGAITGALSGAYNSLTSIPVSWQMKLSPPNSGTSRQSNRKQMIELADALVAVWSGAYDLTPYSKDLQQEGTLCVSAAPRVIRLR